MEIISTNNFFKHLYLKCTARALPVNNIKSIFLFVFSSNILNLLPKYNNSFSETKQPELNNYSGRRWTNNKCIFPTPRRHIHF